MNPQFPIYIVSKGRHESRVTSKYLEKMRVPYFLVGEEQEAETYDRALGSELFGESEKLSKRMGQILVLDPIYQRDYDTFDELGDTKSKGPGAARNFAWDHAIANGHRWRWVMDDNIRGFYRLNHNLPVPLSDGTMFRVVEDFAGRYTNLAMCGPQYFMFTVRKAKLPPFVLNTRIYSCNLIRNDVPFRWRGRYNEDTDLSLRMLKAKWCTVQFYAFLQDKLQTQLLKGGNTEAFYAKEGTLAKSQMLVDMRPDVARLAWRFGRAHHFVNYRPFKTIKLIKRPGVAAEGINDYGMELKRIAPTKAQRSRSSSRKSLEAQNHV